METKVPFKHVTNKAWDKYKKIISGFMDNDAARQTVVWAKHLDVMPAFGEDSGVTYYGIFLEALCYYNAFRNWPINRETVSGETDEENLSILISKSHLEKLGYITDSGYFDFNWVQDRFIINGIPYKPSGDTQVAQAKDEALLFMIILKRDRDTVQKYYNAFRDNQGDEFYNKAKCL